MKKSNVLGKSRAREISPLVKKALVIIALFVLVLLIATLLKSQERLSIHPVALQSTCENASTAPSDDPDGYRLVESEKADINNDGIEELIVIYQQVPSRTGNSFGRNEGMSLPPQQGMKLFECVNEEWLGRYSDLTSIPDGTIAHRGGIAVLLNGRGDWGVLDYIKGKYVKVLPDQARQKEIQRKGQPYSYRARSSFVDLEENLIVENYYCYMDGDGYCGHEVEIVYVYENGKFRVHSSRIVP